MAALKEKIPFWLGTLASVFLLLRALYLPGPLEALDIGPNTKAGGAYLSQVLHWDNQINAFEARRPDAVALYRQDPTKVDSSFRHLYEGCFRGYNLAMILFCLTLGAGTGLFGIMIFFRRRIWVKEHASDAPVWRDALIIALIAFGVLTAVLFVVNAQVAGSNATLQSASTDGSG